MTRKIIVLTPIKNEAWILKTFLTVTSQFADHIILADQNSTDSSREIALTFNKVVLIKNDEEQYKESTRQELLINYCREKFGLNNILLALDADEILSACSLNSPAWDTLRNAESGSVLYFEKPTFLYTTDTIIRYSNSHGWPLGFIDNGAKHNPRLIHSDRLPKPFGTPRIYISDIKFLHFALTRLDAQRAKERYYSMLENIYSTNSWLVRRYSYNKNKNFLKEGNAIEYDTEKYINGWKDKNIDITSIVKFDYYWYDDEAAKLISEYGYKRFWKDDIWDIDWHIVLKLVGINNIKIKYPNFIYRACSNLIFFLFVFAKKMQIKIRK